MYAKLHNFFLNKFLEGSKEIYIEKIKRWTVNNARNLKLSICQKYLELHCPISFCCELRLWGVYNRLVYISPLTFWSRICVFNTTTSTSRCFHSRRWCFINEGVASCYDFVVPGLSMLVGCADYEKIEVDVPFVGKYFLAL